MGVRRWLWSQDSTSSQRRRFCFLPRAACCPPLPWECATEQCERCKQAFSSFRSLSPAANVLCQTKRFVEGCLFAGKRKCERNCSGYGILCQAGRPVQYSAAQRDRLSRVLETEKELGGDRYIEGQGWQTSHPPPAEQSHNRAPPPKSARGAKGGLPHSIHGAPIARKPPQPATTSDLVAQELTLERQLQPPRPGTECQRRTCVPYAAIHRRNILQLHEPRATSHFESSHERQPPKMVSRIIFWTGFGT